MKDIVLKMKALPDLTNEKAWEVVTEGAKEIERLRALFKKVQDHCAGDAHPRWGRDPATSNSRGYLLDICNNALD